jgi:NADPH:quinone reductase-like Zn-dependent oxidoreductase
MVPSHTIARIPASVSYIDAAAIPCAGLTAYNALYRRLNCGSGDIVLVHAEPAELADMRFNWQSELEQQW